MEEYEVIHRPERNRFELEKNGMTAFVEYEVEDGAPVSYTHLDVYKRQVSHS